MPNICPLAVAFILYVLLLPNNGSRTQSAAAAEYSVEFNKSGNGGQTVSLVSGEIGAWWPWHTINDHDGVNLYNASGASVSAVWVKVKDKTNDKFLVPKTAGGDLFPTVWKRKDNTEVLFMDATDLTTDSVFWNRVNDTSGALGATGNIFDGQLYVANPVIPDPDNWVQVSPAPPIDQTPSALLWSSIRKKLPRGFSSVTCYIAVPDESRLFLLSRNIPFEYSAKDASLRPVLIKEPYKNGVNRLHVAGEVLELWKDGELVATVNLKDKSTYGNPTGPRQ